MTASAGADARVEMTCPRVGMTPSGPWRWGRRYDTHAFVAWSTYEQEIFPRGVSTIQRRVDGVTAVTGVRVCKSRANAGDIF